MKIHNFYFSNVEWWIEYIENDQIIKITFNSVEELNQFISINNLPLTYKGCGSCLR
jgi:hypothetical protein